MVEIQDPTMTQHINVRITLPERRAIEQHAQATGATVSQVARAALRWYLAQTETGPEGRVQHGTV